MAAAQLPAAPASLGPRGSLAAARVLAFLLGARSWTLVRWADVFYPDLGSDTQVARGPLVRAIGWLSTDHPFPTGESTLAFLERLAEFVARGNETFAALPDWPALAGPHRCEFCRNFLAAGNIAVPGQGVLYVAPEMIHHYALVHRYCPPDEFVDAVITAPLPGDPAYAERLIPFRAAWAPPAPEGVRR